MEAILTPEEMAGADLCAQQQYGIPSLVLMERAALFAYEEIKKRVDLSRLSNALVVAGVGNNGGDALVVARLLIEDGHSPDVYICGNELKGTDSFKVQKNALEKCGCTFITSFGKKYDLVVDGLFGISLNRDIAGEYRDCVEEMNRQHENGAFAAALDMPSGISALDGSVKGVAVSADMTATFGYRKIGQLLYPGAGYCGEVILGKIGIPEGALAGNRVNILSENEIKLPERKAYSNKGTYGKLLLIAGSEDIAGALILSGMAAMRSGLGMIKIITHEKNRDICAALFPEAMCAVYRDAESASAAFEKSLGWCDAIAVGPGIGTGDAAANLVRLSVMQDRVPVVADADALNIFSAKNDLLKNHKAQLVITPHLGEMSRLTGLRTGEIAARLIDTAVEFSKNNGIVTVLKDARSIIAGPDGQVVINCTGNSGMATAGSGDVLTGIIGALVAGQMPCFEAAALGCALHGRAGDTGAKALSEHELLARDIIKYLAD